MRNIRKFFVFLLFVAFFGVMAYSLLAEPVNDMAENVRSGGGQRAFVMALEGADGNAYALRSQEGQGYILYGINAQGGHSTWELSQGLPEDYAVQSLFVAGDGSILLGLYPRSGVSLGSFALYAAQPGGAFQLLLEAPIAAGTADAGRESAGLVSASQEDGGLVSLVVLEEGTYNRYHFDTAQGQGLTAAGTLTEAEAQALVAEQSEGIARAQNLVQSSGLPLDTVTNLAPTAQGGALAILAEAALYAVSPEGALTNLSAGLYRTPWQSGLILLGIVALVLILAYSCYYAVCEYKKLYFPLVLRNLIGLSLAGYVLVTAAMLLAGGNYRANARENVLVSMQAQLELLEAGEEAELEQAAQALAQTDPAYGDSRLYIFTDAGDGSWTLAASSGLLEPGVELPAPGLLSGEAERLALVQEKGIKTFVARAGGNLCYFAYRLLADGSVLCMQVNARALEMNLDAQLQQISLYMYGAATILILFALLALAAAARGARRVTKGIDLMSAGAHQVQVVQNSGDELEALASAFNDLSGEAEERRVDAVLEGNAYLRFVPRRLVSLLGAENIDQVDKNTSVSREIAMMVVRFTFPQALYQQDAQNLFDNINEVFAHIAGAVSTEGGAIFNFTYDGFDAVFESGSKAAVGAAVGVRQALLDLNMQREARGKSPVELRVALDHGVAMMGVVGDADRVVPTVVSSCLTTARNLVELGKVLDANILCTSSVADVAGEYSLRYIGKARNGEGSIRVYEIVDGDPYGIRLAKESLRESFSTAIYALYSGDFSEAKRLFMDIARSQGDDGVARHYLYLADRYEKQAPAWIGLDINDRK